MRQIMVHETSLAQNFHGAEETKKRVNARMDVEPSFWIDRVFDWASEEALIPNFTTA